MRPEFKSNPSAATKKIEGRNHAFYCFIFFEVYKV
jgi:hypothetical protein